MFGVSKPVDVDENLTDLPELENEDSDRCPGLKLVELEQTLSWNYCQVTRVCAAPQHLQAVSSQRDGGEG